MWESFDKWSVQRLRQSMQNHVQWMLFKQTKQTIFKLVSVRFDKRIVWRLDGSMRKHLQRMRRILFWKLCRFLLLLRQGHHLCANDAMNVMWCDAMDVIQCNGCDAMRCDVMLWMWCDAVDVMHAMRYDRCYEMLCYGPICNGCHVMWWMRCDAICHDSM